MPTPRILLNKACLYAAGLFCAGLVAQTSTALAADYHVLPAAAGMGDGSSWENAAAAPSGVWDEVLSKLEPGDTLRVGSGEYRDAVLVLTRGGDKGAPVSIVGADTGAGLPVFSSGWVKEQPGVGSTLITLSPGVGHVAIRDLRVRNHISAVVTEGGNDTVVITGLDVRDVRAGVIFKNNAVADKPETWTRNVFVENCNFVGFTRSALRWEGGNRDFRIVNVHGDAGGKPYATDPFHMVFNLRGDQRKDLPEGAARAHDRNVTFIGCVARNAYHEAPKGKSYWNADGFVAERGVTNLTFIDCMAFDCTDGGWDLKATGMTFKGCVAFRNKRNYRIWNDATFENCIAGYPLKRGGSGDAHNFGVYGAARLKLDHCTIIGEAAPFGFEKNDQGKDIVRVAITDSLLIAAGDASVAGDIPGVKLANTERFSLANPPKGPVFSGDASAAWDGRGKAFNPTPAYRGQGFRRE
jgi:hypothetical protein